MSVSTILTNVLKPITKCDKFDEIGYKAFISILCNFDIWCKIQFDE